MRITRKLSNRLLLAVLLGMTIPNIFVLWNSRGGLALGYGDFTSFYTAGTLLRRGLGAQLYDRDAQWNVQQEFASEVKVRRGPLRYIRLPYEAALFAFFAIWSYPTALVLWTIFKLVLLLAIPFFCMRRQSWGEGFPPWIAGLLSLGTFPVFFDFLQGQDAVLITFIFAIAFWLLAREMDGWAGFVLGLALFKFLLVLPFVVILWVAGKGRTAFGFVVAAVGAFAVSVAIVGWTALRQYPAYLLNLNRTPGVGVITAEYQVNFRGLLTLLVGRSTYPGSIHWILLPIALAAIVYAGRAWRRAAEGMLAEGFALALLTSILTSYYSHVYDLTLLAVPFFALRGGYGRRSRDDLLTRVCEITGTLLLLLTPLYWFLVLHTGAVFFMAIPLIAVSVALLRRLNFAAADPARAPSFEGLQK